MQEPNNLSSPLLQQVERGRESRRRLFGRLCRLGIMLRMITMLNAIALMGAVGYSLYIRGADELRDNSLGIEPRVRTAVEYALMALSGIFLWCLESTSTTEEAAMRSSLGLAFGASGRLGLFLFLALCSAPAIHCDHTPLEMYASGGAVAFLILSGLLQAWMLTCAPEYRGTVVAALETQKIKTDSTPDVFPQIYQRDEGTHLHLGVLIPGFASRDTCKMCVRTATPRFLSPHPCSSLITVARPPFRGLLPSSGRPIARPSLSSATSPTSRRPTRRSTAATRSLGRSARSSVRCSSQRPSTSPFPSRAAWASAS